jgi:hypothetical protein
METRKNQIRFAFKAEIKGQTALFSGRFSPPNLGHVLTILRLLQDFKKVVVVILDYPERKGCTVDVAQDIFGTVFKMIGIPKERLVIAKNDIHFGKITSLQLEGLLNNLDLKICKTTYVGGNQEVNDHIMSLGLMDVMGIKRVVISDGITNYLPKDQYIFESTRIRDKIDKGESLGGQYNIHI